jgi:E3 ubiquitin-protein ligase RNF5
MSSPLETQPLRMQSNDEVYTEEREDGPLEQRFECNVCLDDVREPIVTQCGHLYCWPCLYRWLNTGHSTCPMCKAGISEDNVIPLFIRGSEQDPRAKKVDVPNRPNAHRPVPSPLGSRTGALGGDGTNNQMTTAYGFFPSLFGLQFQSFVPIDEDGTADSEQYLFLSRVLVLLVFTVCMCLIVF